MTLYRWSRKRAIWEWELECADDPASKKRTLRNVKRRSPVGTIFRWTDGQPPERAYRQRALKETT